jgi:hypothetical protein
MREVVLLHGRWSARLSATTGTTDRAQAHTLRSEADLREQRGRQAGPGVDLDELDRFSRERNISLLSRGQQRSTLRDLAFIEACRRQIKLIQANQFPPPHCSDHPAAALKPSYHPARPHRRRSDSKRALDASPNPMASEPPPTAHAAESAGTHAGADDTGTVAAAPSVSFADDVATAPVPSMSAADEIAAAVTSELLQAAIVSAAAPQEEGDAGGGGGGELQPPVGGSPGPGTGPARDDEGNAWESMKLGELRRLAGARGVSLDAIDDALDADAPKAALITLLQAC